MEITQPDGSGNMLQAAGNNKSGELHNTITHLIEQLGLIASTVNHTGKV